ncbi:MAG TPA: F0F1 ATP synthase subunit delta [Gammaproteobacteria bacterium]
MADYGTIARPYARAAFDIAKEAGALDSWSKALAAAAAVVSNEDVERVLSSPDLTDDARVALIADLGSALPGAELFGDERFRSLLRVLAENDRLAALPEISEQFDGLKADAENKIDVTLVSATSVEPDIAEKISRALERRLGRQVQLKVEIDEKLLGGAIIRAEDMVIDGSVRTRLERLTRTLVA